MTWAFVRACAAASVVAAAGWSASGDDAVDQINGMYADIRQEDRSDLVLLPLIAGMDATPGGLAPGPDGTLTGRLATPEIRMWPALSAWAEAEPQQAVLKAIHDVTQEPDYRYAMAFGQPYGVDATARDPGGIDLVADGLYTELGDPPTLIGAQHLYLPALETVQALVHIEATRLLFEGRADDALTRMIDWVFFARQMADRVLLTEAAWGYRAMITGLARLRDIAYLDARGGPGTLTGAQLIAQIERLSEERGYIGLDRLRYPQGDRIAARQLVELTMDPGGGPNAEFATRLAQLAATDRPLRLFSEAAAWRRRAGEHAGQSETLEQVERVFGDWSGRWSFGWFDHRMEQPFVYTDLDKARFGLVVLAAERDVLGTPVTGSDLYSLRQMARTEWAGTRTALAVLGYAVDNRAFPPRVQSVRPRYVVALDADPFNPNSTKDAAQPMEYFVPIRDQRGSDQPHNIAIVTDAGVNFQVYLYDDEFVLYSVGSDESKDWARQIQNTTKPIDGDYLIWPPVLSLERTHMISQGMLK